uniref:Uncharacterized protein n=1 Tax=Glossina pallidipes TaxID=7398 RepID=A0A1A9Z628_GLOPL
MFVVAVSFENFSGKVSSALVRMWHMQRYLQAAGPTKSNKCPIIGKPFGPGSFAANS